MLLNKKDLINILLVIFLLFFIGCDLSNDISDDDIKTELESMDNNELNQTLENINVENNGVLVGKVISTVKVSNFEVPVQKLIVVSSESEKINCEDGIDNDGDGSIDCFDGDCTDNWDICKLKNNIPVCCLFHNLKQGGFVDNFNIQTDCFYPKELGFNVKHAGRYPVLNKKVCEKGVAKFGYEYISNINDFKLSNYDEENIEADVDVELTEESEVDDEDSEEEEYNRFKERNTNLFSITKINFSNLFKKFSIPSVEIDCKNNMDDDDDNFIDCADPDCYQNFGDNSNSKICTCKSLDNCHESLCQDNFDNDGDGYADCDDSDCSSTSACVEMNCNDDLDNDADGNIDCDDEDCEMNCDDFSFEHTTCVEMESVDTSNWDSDYTWGGTSDSGYASNGFPYSFWLSYWDIEPDYGNGLTPPREYYLCLRAAVPKGINKQYPYAQFKIDLIVNNKLRIIEFSPFSINHDWIAGDYNYPDWDKNPQLTAAIKIIGRVKPRAPINLYFKESPSSEWIKRTKSGPGTFSPCHTSYNCAPCNKYGEEEPKGFCHNTNVANCIHTENPNWCLD